MHLTNCDEKVCRKKAHTDAPDSKRAHGESGEADHEECGAEYLSFELPVIPTTDHFSHQHRHRQSCRHRQQSLLQHNLAKRQHENKYTKKFFFFFFCRLSLHFPLLLLFVLVSFFWFSSFSSSPSRFFVFVLVCFTSLVFFLFDSFRMLNSNHYITFSLAHALFWCGPVWLTGR